MRLKVVERVLEEVVSIFEYTWPDVAGVMAVLRRAVMMGKVKGLLGVCREFAERELGMKRDVEAD